MRPAPSRFVELFKQTGSGPYSLVAPIHDGCRTHKYGGLTQVAGLARALADEGIAVWNIEYRGMGDSGWKLTLIYVIG